MMASDSIGIIKWYEWRNQTKQVHLLEGLKFGGDRHRFFRTPSRRAWDSRLFIKLVLFSFESMGRSFSSVARAINSSLNSTKIDILETSRSKIIFNGPTLASFAFIFSLFNQSIQLGIQKNYVISVHQVSCTRIQTHDLLITSILP